MAEFLKGFYDGLKPIPILSVSDWAEKHRYLTSESAAEPGLWKTARTPYLRQIMDDLSPNSPINEVIVMKGVQLGFSESALNCVGCFIDIAPCPVMYVMPTAEMAKGLSEGRVDPMIANSPTLSEKVRPPRERDSGNTKFVKKFAGGLLVLTGANSAAGLRSRPVKVLILDEVDGYPLSVGEEGSPVMLAKKRTSTFGFKRKIYELSTPTVENISVIEKDFLATDQNYYFVPCPHCNHKQELKFENLQYEKGNYTDVKYACIECGTLIEERFKTKMLEGGEWRSTVPANKNPIKRGYHLNSLYSPIGWLSWAEIVEEYEKSENDENAQRVFTNTILGETYKNKGDVPDWQRLYSRSRGSYAPGFVNKNICFLTAGVDVQRDRLEMEVVGWAPGKISYSIERIVLIGDTAGEKVWKDLSKKIDLQYEREDGFMLPIEMTAIDSGYNTSSVHTFCRKYDSTKVIPVKGDDRVSLIISSPRTIDTTVSGKRSGYVRVWRVGVSVVKSELYGWLRLDKDETTGEYPPGYCHFPEYEQEYFRGITAETLTFRVKNGHRKWEWVKKYERNEPLDLRVYARAAAAVCGMDRFQEQHWQEMQENYQQAPTERIEPKKKKPDSNFWKGKSFW